MSPTTIFVAIAVFSGLAYYLGVRRANVGGWREGADQDSPFPAHLLWLAHGSLVLHSCAAGFRILAGVRVQNYYSARRGWSAL